MIELRNIKLILFVALIGFLPESLFSQIKVYERKGEDVITSKGLYTESDHRIKVDMNGKWDVSFNEAKSFVQLNVPLCYEFRGDVIFHRNLQVDYNAIRNYSFILVAEGINYESEIYINNTFIIKHTGGFNSIIVPIDDGIISTDNFIQIKVNSELTNTNSIPLSNQINYGKNYGGIYRDIYFIGVPKIYTFSSKLEYTLSTNNQVMLKNNLNIKSTTLNGQLTSNEFTVKTEVYDDSTGSLIGESQSQVFNIGNFSSEEQINTLNLTAIQSELLWSPVNPKLYLVKSIIKDENGNVIDVKNELTGFRTVSVKRDHVELNGTKILINAINYYENTPELEMAVDYISVERDLKLIKDAGFNAIRVPGRTAHPYVVDLCNKIGLFLFQEIPFNEVPVQILSDFYSNLAYLYLSSVIIRDRNSPSVIAWGIGNDFDVTSQSFAGYVKASRELAQTLDKRQVYYTTRNFHGDACEYETDFRGLNIFPRKTSTILKAVDLFSSSKQQIHSPQKPMFISRYGVSINNENSEGYANSYSVEYQSKFLVDAFEMMYNRFPATVMSSFSDWNSERPLNFRQNANPYLVTDGIFTIYRQPKLSVQFVSRILQQQDYPKIMEGEAESDYSYYLIGTGVILNITFFLIFLNFTKFRNSFIRFLFRPAGFFQQINDQLLIPVTLSVIISLLISLGIGLYISSVIYFYRESNLFDVVLAKLITSDGLKIFFSYLSNFPLYAIVFFTVVNLLLLVLSFFIIRIVVLFLSSMVHNKTIITVVCWSSLVLFPFMIIGMLIYNLGTSNSDYITFSLILLCFLHIVYLLRIIKGAKILINLSFFKSYMYGLFFIILIYGSVYAYLKFFNGTINAIKLSLSYFT